MKEYTVDWPLTVHGLMMNAGEVNGYVAFLGYKKLPDGSEGPAEKAKLVRNNGDRIMYLDSKPMKKKSFREVIKSLEEYYKKKTVRICFLEMKSDYPIVDHLVQTGDIPFEKKDEGIMFIEKNMDKLLLKACEKKCKNEILELVQTPRPAVRVSTLVEVFKILPKETDNQYNNTLAKTIFDYCEILTQSNDNEKLLFAEISDRLESRNFGALRAKQEYYSRHNISQHLLGRKHRLSEKLKIMNMGIRALRSTRGDQAKLSKLLENKEILQEEIEECTENFKKKESERLQAWRNVSKARVNLLSDSVHYLCYRLHEKLEIGSDIGLSVPRREITLKHRDLRDIENLTKSFFDVQTRKNPLFLKLDQKYTSPVIDRLTEKKVIDKEAFLFIQTNMDQLLLYACGKPRKLDIQSFIQTKPVLKASTLVEVFKSLPKVKGDHYNNSLAKSIVKNCEIVSTSRDDFRLIATEISGHVGIKSRRAILDLVRKNFTPPLQRKNDLSNHMETNNVQAGDIDGATSHPKPKKAMKIEDTFKSKYESRITAGLEYFDDMLKEFMSSTYLRKLESEEDDDEKEVICFVPDLSRKKNAIDSKAGEKSTKLSSSQVALAIAQCQKLPEEEQESMLEDVEMNMDLSDFNLESEWTVEITEEAHKWFRKHRKKQNDLCKRVISRLKILATGRWPYVLCKPLVTKKSNLKLYETKIDSGSRIIWEVAVSFSPRRSSSGNSFSEQVIRVWDIVLDHDKLSDRINLVLDRITQSVSRGELSAVSNELAGDISSNLSKSSSGIIVPRVFTMKQVEKSNTEVRTEESSPKVDCIVHFPPANPDPLKYTLLKFYQLNTDAIKILLESSGDDDETDLPFTPGPLEHRIIHHRKNPQRSILLMGRSGTGKTTCLVFRMWAQHMAYLDNLKGQQPKQLFITKNDVLRNEVERSFSNMGLAFRKQSLNSNDHDPNYNEKLYNTVEDENSDVDYHERTRFPLFLTSNEWLYLLDEELPGERFFTPKEIEARFNSRNSSDLEKGIQAIDASRNNQIHSSNGTRLRCEMSYKTFLKSWVKINSRQKSDLNPAMVWREICTFIKGSIGALKLEDPNRDIPCNRFLTLQEYLKLPRKQSRLSQEQRKSVYCLYKIYEQVKRDGNFYDIPDVVYNLAGRSLRKSGSDYNSRKLLPIDSLFVDEVQDFTMAELYLLTKLSRDPNNLMLAGDTAQSITEGVAFRFTDVRQIFYELFGGIEPDLLQLTHNYRSHSGILRLAACVVELLYFFFSDSLDRLPPDLGLFDGPKPIIMDGISSEDLALMLHGSQREQSRIEFGAHQIVIVRNESVKQKLAEELGIDRDWIMTVENSKGLEFDDVFLYNFFTESDAGNLWRIVSNYTKAHATEYYSNLLGGSSSYGVQSFEWDNLITSACHHLEFNHEQHKILETELKVLYTAITRARVRIFIAETSKVLSSPMFNYFKQRRVVNEVQAATTDEENIPTLPVFGKMSSAKDWEERGDLYLRAANGDNKLGYIRLAAKCFARAGNQKRHQNVLAILAYEEQEDDGEVIRSTQQRERLYSIATQLLEAKDIVFLDKVGFCLYKSGKVEKARCARIFELYARLSYAKREKELNCIPNTAEQQYFNLAADFYDSLAKENDCPSERNHQETLKGRYFVHAMRNYLCTGSIKGWEKVSDIIDNNLQSLEFVSTEVHQLFSPSDISIQDPVSYFHFQLLQTTTSKYDFLRDSISKLDEI